MGWDSVDVTGMDILTRRSVGGSVELTDIQVTISECHQMATLLQGLNTSLYMMNRLKVYIEYYTGLPASAATLDMRAALVEFSAAILSFLAEPISTFQKDTALQTL